MNESLEFHKMTGAGNDFVLLDYRRKPPFEMEMSELARLFCKRAMSVGADGVVFLEASKKAHFKARFFNRDGSESSFCGNGARCAARFGFLKVIAGRTMTIETKSGIISAEVMRGGSVRLLFPSVPSEPVKTSVEINGKQIPGYSTNAGVPHFVIFVTDTARVPVPSLGRKIRFDDIFGVEGTNVDFISAEGDGPFPIRTYERGVEGETLACGSGAVAAAWVMNKIIKENQQSSFPMLTRSGKVLEIDIDTSRVLPRISLSGEARLVYVGNISFTFLKESTKC